MQIAVTSQNRKTVTDHAGKCRNFWLYRIDNQQVQDKQLIELSKEQSFHECAHAVDPLTPHPLDDIHVLMTGGLGQGLQNRLKQKNIQAVVTTETDPDQAIFAWLNGAVLSKSCH